jgi:hypothetical protein
VRDYAGDGQPPRTSPEQVSEHFRALFDTYTIEAVDVMVQVVETWFTMAELRWRVSDADGERWTFRTADLTSLDGDDHIAVQLGWGTDPVRVV